MYFKTTSFLLWRLEDMQLLGCEHWSCTCLRYSLLAKPVKRRSVCVVVGNQALLQILEITLHQTFNQHRLSGFLTWYASLFLLIKFSLFLISLTGDVVRLQRRQVIGNKRAAMREGEKGGSCTRTLSKADHLECVR